MLRGAYTAMVTPFASDGSIDFPAVARLLAWHESQGMDGVVVAGTNGEGTSLSAPEKRDLVEFAVKHAGALRIVAGLGTCSITEAVWLAKQADKAGAEAVLSLPPFYFKAASEYGLFEWFATLIRGTDIPVILYNFPLTTGITLSEELVRKLLSEGAAGIKDSSGDFDLFQSYLHCSPDKPVLVGDERLILRALGKGGAGAISGLANSFPRLISRAVHERDFALQTFIEEAVKAIKIHPHQAAHKYVLSIKGLPGGRVRPPLEPLSPDAMQLIEKFIARFGF